MKAKKKEDLDNKKIVAEQSYTIRLTNFDDGSTRMYRHNDGFTLFEMLGIATLIQADMLDLVKKAFKTPEKVVRTTNNVKISQKSVKKNQ